MGISVLAVRAEELIIVYKLELECLCCCANKSVTGYGRPSVHKLGVGGHHYTSQDASVRRLYVTTVPVNVGKLILEYKLGI